MPIQRNVSDFSKETNKFHQPPTMDIAVRTFLLRSQPNPSGSNTDQQADFEAKIEFMKMVWSRFGEETKIYKRFLELLIRYKNGDSTVVCRGIYDLFQGHADVQEAFVRVVGLSRFELQGLAFCEKLRGKLAENSDDDKAYMSFLKMLNDHSTGFVELQMYVSDLVENCPVIMKELANFLHAFEESDQ